MKRLREILIRLRKFYESKNQKLVYFYSTGIIDRVILEKDFYVIKVNSETEYAELCKKLDVCIKTENINRINRGSVLYALCKDTELVSSGWCAFKEKFWIAESDTVIDMSLSEVVIFYDFETNINYRCNGYYANLLKYMMYDMSWAHNFLIYAKKENMASCKGIKNAGFKEEGIFSQNQEKFKEYLNSKNFQYLGHRYLFGGLKYARNM